MDRDEIYEELIRLKEEMLSEEETDIACCLLTLMGAIKSGYDKQLATLMARFAQEALHGLHSRHN